MNTLSQKRQIDNVGGDYRPRAHVTRPRGRTLCVGVPKGGPPTTSTSPTTWAATDNVKPPTSKQRYTIVVEGFEGAGIRGLRLLLKRLVRGYGLRCISAVEIQSTESRLTEPE